MKKIEFTKAKRSDIDEIVDMFRYTIKEMNANGIPQWDEIYPCRDDLLHDMEQQELYVGKIEGKAAGAYVLNQECDDEYQNGMWLYPDANYYVIHRLCVSSHFQKQGIGTRTVQHIEEQAKNMGAETIRLDAFTLNPHALNLYEKLGYREVGIANFRKGKFYLMEKKLSE